MCQAPGARTKTGCALADMIDCDGRLVGCGGILAFFSLRDWLNTRLERACDVKIVKIENRHYFLGVILLQHESGF